MAYRLHRWKAHETPEVLDLLTFYGVLILHGPPYYPRFYGQLERQNREHRRILDAAGVRDAAALPKLCNDMLRSVNELWPRRQLGWRIPQAVWDNRQRVVDDHNALRDEVSDRASRIARASERREVPRDFFERIAIERALEKPHGVRKNHHRRGAAGRCLQ